MQLKKRHRTIEKTFWTRVLNFATMHGIPIHGLATIPKEQYEKRSAWRKRSASGNHIQDLFTALLDDRGSFECFRYDLSIKTKTGNKEVILNASRQMLVPVGLGSGSLFLSRRHIKRAISLIMKMFDTICEPERTSSVFRVSSLKTGTFASLSSLQKRILKALKLIFGMSVAKLGGGVKVTRLAFRIFNTTVSGQLSKAVFCFASSCGNDSRYAMEQNCGPSILSNQESGWLYRQTEELQALGVEITYSCDRP